MDRENPLSPENLPLDLGELGEVTEAKAVIPGVYEVILHREELIVDIVAFIVFSDTPVISDTAKKYGVFDPDYPELLVYKETSTGNTCYMIEYELFRYKTMHNIPVSQEDSICSIVAYGRELYPEYFGAYPAPACTPWGRMTRYKTIANGVFWLETEYFQRGLAVTNIKNDDLSHGALRLADNIICNHDPEYLFFQEMNSSVPLFELILLMTEEDLLCQINPYALMNALYTNHLEYVVGNNAIEQAGLCINGKICFAPQMGTEFITF